MTKEYLLSLPIEPCLVGDVYGPNTPLPLHCTLLHWFRVREECSASEIHDALSRVALELAESSPRAPERNMCMESEGPALFGPNNDVPVHVLRACGGLGILHEKVLYALGSRVIHSEERWIGSGWRPHVSTVDDRAFLPRMRHVPTQFVCIERNERKEKKVTSFYILPPKG